MEYLSRVCTELQQNELQQKHQNSTSDNNSNKSSTKKRRLLQSEEIKQYKSIDSFVAQINRTLDTIKKLLMNHEDSTLETQQEFLKV
jgi:hypothetical protein